MKRVLILAALWLSACATGGTGGGVEPQPSPTLRRCGSADLTPALPYCLSVVVTSRDVRQSGASVTIDGRVFAGNDNGWVATPVAAGTHTVTASKDGLVSVTRPVPVTWHTREVIGINPLAPPVPPVSRVRVVDRRFQNDLGWWGWRGVSDFGAVGYVLTGREAELAQRFDAYVRAKRTVVRVMGMLGDPAWAGRNLAFSPRTSFYWAALDTTYQLATARGMNLELCIFADAQIVVPSKDERIAWLRQYAAFIKERPGIIPQLANEPFKNGWTEADDSDLIALGDLLASLLGHRDFSIGDPVDEHDPDLAPKTAERLKHLAQHSNILVVHPDRGQYGDTGRWRRWLDHLEGFSDVISQTRPGVTLVLDEPNGAGRCNGPCTDGRRDDDPEAFIAAQFIAAVVGVGYTYHWIVEEHAEGKSPFTVDTLPGFYAAADLLTRVPVSPDWQYKNDSWAGAPTEGITWIGRAGKVRHLVHGPHAWSIAYGDGDWNSVHWRSGFTPHPEWSSPHLAIWTVNP